MVIDGINFKELNITKDGELIASITDGKDGIVHKDGYRVQLVVEDVGMSFAEAFKRMKAGRKVKHRGVGTGTGIQKKKLS